MVAFRKTHIVCARRFALKNLKQFFKPVLFNNKCFIFFETVSSVLFPQLESRFFGDLVFNC